MDNLIGVPFEWGGRGPDKFDCYGLVMHLYREAHGVELPDYMSPSNSTTAAIMMAKEMSLWKSVDQQVNSVVLIRVNSMAAHVGFVLNSSKFTHTWEKSGGVVVERLSTWQRRIIGYYEYVGK
jgi:cell wall-associated NlpC family hydrolase